MTTRPLFDARPTVVPEVKEPRLKIPRSPIILAVTGGRDYRNEPRIHSKLDKYHERYRFTHLLHGGATGLDTIADEWCDTRSGVQSVRCRAHWNRDGNKAAGPLRNDMMAILRPIVLLSFPGGTGTAGMTALCRSYGIKVITIGR